MAHTRSTRQRPRGLPRDIWKAYGDHFPSGPKRAAAERAARQRLAEMTHGPAVTQADRERIVSELVNAVRAKRLWHRVHPNQTTAA